MMQYHTIDDNQRRRIVKALEREDVSNLSPIAELCSPHELHQFVVHFNWDDGNDTALAVLDHPLCDYGTALLIYWLSGPIVCEATRSYVIENWPWSISLYDRIEKLERQLLKGAYSIAEFSVDPRNILNDGIDLTRRPTEDAFVRSPPAQLCVPSPGWPMLEDDLVYELTPEELLEREREEIEYDINQLRLLAEQDPAYKPNLEAYRRKYGLND